MTVRIAMPDVVSPSYFPVIAAVELGLFERESLEAEIELVFPVTQTFASLRDGNVDFVAGSAHAPLHAFEDWQGCRLLCALSQHMYWFLVVRKDLNPRRGDLDVVKGLRIAAAPGPVDGLKRMLATAGIDPDRDVDIGPAPPTEGAGTSFGVLAATALIEGKVDGFWANGMGAEVAMREGAGALVADARRGDGPPGARDFTFPGFVTTQERIDEQPEHVAGAVRAVVAAQQTLRRDPSLAQKAAASHFPPTERELIAELIERDAPFYDPSISSEKVASMNRFAQSLGLLSNPEVPRERVVAMQFAPLWQGPE